MPLEGVHSYSFFSLVILLFYLLYLKEKNKQTSPVSKRVIIFSDAGCPVDWTLAQPPAVQSLDSRRGQRWAELPGTQLLCCCLPASNSTWFC